MPLFLANIWWRIHDHDVAGFAGLEGFVMIHFGIGMTVSIGLLLVLGNQ